MIRFARSAAQATRSANFPVTYLTIERPRMRGRFIVFPTDQSLPNLHFCRLCVDSILIDLQNHNDFLRISPDGHSSERPFLPLNPLTRRIPAKPSLRFCKSVHFAGTPEQKQGTRELCQHRDLNGIPNRGFENYAVLSIATNTSKLPQYSFAHSLDSTRHLSHWFAQMQIYHLTRISRRTQVILQSTLKPWGKMRPISG